MYSESRRFSSATAVAATITSRTVAAVAARRGRARLRSRSLSMGMLAATLLLSSSAHAYDLSRIPDEHDKPGRGETVFIDGMVGIWLPGPSTFDTNHTVSFTYGAEFGVTFLRLRGHQFLAVGGFTFSPQTLEPHLEEASSDMIQGMGGVRWVPGATCLPGDVGCAFLEASLGLTWESAEQSGEHSAPRGELTLNLGAGYRFNLGDHVHLGGRIDMGYLQESRTREIGWFTPTLFAGASF